MATCFVTPGADGSGNGTSISTPWTLAQALAASLTGADTVRLCGSPFNLTGASKSWTGVGTDDAPLKIQGADASGNSYVGTSSMVTLNGSGMDSGVNMFTYGAVNAIRYSNLRFTAARNHAFSVESGINLWMYDCQVDSSIGSGIYTTMYSASFSAFRSRFNSNGAWGLKATAGQRGRSNLHFCTIDHNTSGGIYDSMYADGNIKPLLRGCLIYRNGGPGAQYINTANSGFVMIDQCVFFANTSHGLVLPNSTAGEFLVENSIFLDNGGYGINTATTTDLNKFLFRNLCSYGNTSGHIDINSGTLPGTGHVLEDPAFTSETDGSEDLRPRNSNLLVAQSLPAGGKSYFFMGAVQPCPSQIARLVRAA